MYKYDLEERVNKFSENLVEFCRKVSVEDTFKSAISQLFRSGTSIGANYMEANGASSKRDFRNKIYLCKKEALETKYWLRIIAKIQPQLKNEVLIHWRETQELTLIFSKIISSLQDKI
ncbi:MAG: four helix bundle protein [Patescibacteria group bacterium]|jgi:four helix bundle protein